MRSSASASGFGDIPLMVDANAAYTLDDAPHLAELDRFDLMMIEQPLDYDDLRDHATLQRRLRTPICLDESIHSVRAAAEAIALGACRIINIKPGRVGGHGRVDSRCTIWRRRTASRSGTAACSRAASAARTTSTSRRCRTSRCPGDVAASRRYYAPDLIEPEIEVPPDGTIAVPTGPGIGVHVVADRVAAATEETMELRA